VAKLSVPLVAMHPRGADDVADVIVSPIPRTPEPRARTVLSGLRYACLRPDFWTAVPAAPPANERPSVLVTAGGGAGDAARTIAAELVARGGGSLRISVVRGRGATWTPVDGVALLDAPETLRRAYADADLVVTAAGQTALEALAAGRATIVFTTARNQEPQAAYLAAKSLVIACPTVADVVEAVERLATQPDERSALADRGRLAVDGRGALRVAAKLVSQLL
jgi:spore coat polysaccharide biosynthesis predicted glycosyltransferase SpsG